MKPLIRAFPLLLALASAACPARAAEGPPSKAAQAAVASLRGEQVTYDDWEAVLRIGQDAVPELQKLISDPSDAVRARAAVLLYRLGEAGALDPLAALLESRDEDARREAADALRAFLGAPMAFDSAAPLAGREKALAPWKVWWKANRDEALKIPPMSRLSAQVLSVDAKAKLVGLGLTAKHGARRGMQFGVVRGTEPVCLVELVLATPEASVARIVELSERVPPRAGDRAFWSNASVIRNP